MKTPVNQRAARRRLKKALARRKAIGKTVAKIRNQKRKEVKLRYAALISAIAGFVRKR